MTFEQNNKLLNNIMQSLYTEKEAYASYKNYENLYSVLQFIQTNFGIIQRVIHRTYRKDKLNALLVKHNDCYFIITLGGNRTTESKREAFREEEVLLESVFGEIARNSPIEYSHEEYFCKVQNIDENLNNALDLLYLTALNPNGYKVKKDCEIFKLAEKHYFYYDVERHVATMENSNCIVKFCAPIFEDNGVVRVLPKKSPTFDIGDNEDFDAFD